MSDTEKTERSRKPLRIEPAEEPRAAIGHNSGRAVAIGRDGAELTRKRTITSDMFHIPDDAIPDGWSYQWNVLEVMGQLQTATSLSMAENGWRPVPSGRHRGMFMPEGTPADAPIVRDGLILEERPAILTEEARRDESGKARRQMREQIESLKLADKLPSGFSDEARYRGAGAMARQSIGPAPELSRPQLQIDPT